MATLQDILHPLVQQYLAAHSTSDYTKIALQKKGVENVSPSLLAEQIKSRQKIKDKVPAYYQASNIVYPPSLNLEQSSSQATAIFKASIVRSLLGNKDLTIVDLTGGFGIDSLFLSKECASLKYIEPNAELAAITEHNHKQLNAFNIGHVVAYAETFLQNNSSTFDLLFLDPSRRSETRKVHLLEDCSPNVLALKSALFKSTKNILIKTSPLLDISSTIAALGCVKKIWVVSVENECKEVLYWCVPDFVDEPVIEAVDLSNKGEALNSFSFSFPEERMSIHAFSSPLTYLYEPNASILKAGAFKKTANSFSLAKLSVNTHVYTSADLVNEFPGRVFKIEALVKPDAKSIVEFLPDRKANVLTRNYPLSPEQLKKKLKLNDGGEKYVFGFSGEVEKYLAICVRIF
jgi:16S rRNA G966 N2-methylase RsmD